MSVVTEKKKRLLKKELTSTVQIISLGFQRAGFPRVYVNLFCNGTRLLHVGYDRLEVICSSWAAEVLLMLFRAVKSSIVRTALLCSSTLRCSVVCERPGPCYRRAVFIGDVLAVHGSPCSCALHGQSAMVAPVQQRRQPDPLGSIDEHEYCGYACRSKHFLFGPCVPV
jgi:hypothetical protein